jgi:hypothetical protein
VPINAVSFDVFQIEGRHILVRHLVLEEEPPPPIDGTKHQPPRSRKDFVRLAYQNKVGEAFEQVLALEDILPAVRFYVRGVSFTARTPDNKPVGILSVYPTGETYTDTLTIYMLPQNLAAVYGVPVQDCTTFVQQMQSVGKPLPASGTWMTVGLTTLEQAKEFDRRFREFVTATPNTLFAESAMS